MWNFFNGVGDAAESVDKQLKKFESYFSTVEDKTQFYNLIFDVLGLGFSTAAAPIFNTCKCHPPFYPLLPYHTTPPFRPKPKPTRYEANTTRMNKSPEAVKLLHR